MTLETVTAEGDSLVVSGGKIPEPADEAFASLGLPNADLGQVQP